MDHAETVAGIDVGGPIKGFHAVLLRSGKYLAQMRSSDPKEIALWCRKMKVEIVGIDAPCQWRKTEARLPERELLAQKIRCFSTPKREEAERHPTEYFHWMLGGEALFNAFRETHPLFQGEPYSKDTKVSFETFPHAVTCVLLGKVVPAKNKRNDRSEILKGMGIEMDPRSPMDFIDAALCAVAATYLARNQFHAFGDRQDGYIIVPKLT